MRLWLDTSFLVGIVFKRDRYHEAASDVLRRIARTEWSGVYTSDYVVAELLNLLRGRFGRAEIEERALALLFGTGPSEGILAGLVRIQAGRFALAVDRYRKYRDQGLSFTDCTTLIAMEDEGVGQIATFDRGFDGLVDVVPAHA